MPKRDYLILVLLLFAIFLLQCISSMSLKSATGDEKFYIVSAQELVNGSDWSTWTNIIHAPLTCYIHGFALKWFHFKDFDAKLFWARMVMLIFGVWLGFILLNWSRELYGRFVSIFVLTLYVFSPNMLAHARLITHDIPISAIGMASFYCFWKFYSTDKLRYMFAASFLVGLGLLAKLAGILLLPLYFIMFLALCCIRINRSKGQGLKRASAAGITLLQWTVFTAIALFILNAGYFFKGSFIYARENIWMSDFFLKMSKSVVGKVLFFVFPDPYLLGLDFQRYFSEYGFPAFLMGKFSVEGWWYFFPLVLLIKTPVPVLILCLGYLILALSRGSRPLGDGKWIIVVPAVVYLAYFTGLNNFNVGIRHVIILYPLVFMLLGGLFAYIFKKGVFIKSAFFALLIWYLFNSFSIYPHYLAFANMFIGGPENGYKNLIDANFEWGQDYKLAKIYAQKSDKEVIFSTDIPMEGRIAINSSRLNGYMSTVDKYKWLRSLEPVDKIGYTWIVYDVDADSLELRIKSNPKDMELYYALSYIYINKKEYDKAAKVIATALRVDDSYAKIHFVSGLLNMHLQQQDAALEEFKQTVSLDPKAAEAFEYIAFIYEVQGKPEKAERATKDMMISESRKSFLKEPEYSFSYYEDRIKRDPADFRAYNNLGFLYWASDNDDEALKYFSRAIEINSAFVDAYCNLAYVLEEKGQLEQALEVRKTYLNLLSSTKSYQEPRVFFEGVVMCNRTFVIQQMPVEQERRYLKMLRRKIALKVDPKDFLVCHEIAIDYMWLRRSALSLRFAKKALDINPDFSQGYVTMAILYGEKGFSDLAKSTWRDMTKIKKQ